MVRVDWRQRLGGVEEPLVAHVAFTAAEEDVGTLLPLHTLVTADDMEPKSPSKHEQTSSARTHHVS